MTDQPTACDLCGLPVRNPHHRLEYQERTLYFCCNGCRQVFTILAESADQNDPESFTDTDLYRQCVRLGIVPDPGASQDPPEELSTADGASGDPEGLSLSLQVDGMWCPACAWVIEQALMRKDGVLSAECMFAGDRLHCRYHPAAARPDDIIAAVAALGYRAHPASAGNEGGGITGEAIRLGLAAFFTMNVMMLSAALYTGFFAPLGPDDVFKISLPMFLMAAVVYGWCGAGIHRRAVAGIREGAPGMEALISIGATSAFAYSTVNMLRGNIHQYFDTTCMLISLVLLGKMLEYRAKTAVRKDLADFYARIPNKARIVTDAFPAGRYVHIDQVAVGDVCRIVPGDIIATDGVVIDGSGTVDESTITGESRPIAKQAGARLTSGTTAVDGDLRMRVLTVGNDTTLMQMVTIMQRALGRKSPMEGRAERILRWFVPGIVMLAAATGVVTAQMGLGIEQALVRAVTVLVITCPCALGVAVPLARVAGISLAARNGILVRSAEAFQRASYIGTAVFDKTGTLTTGQWILREIRPLSNISGEKALGMALALEKTSVHPVADAVRQAARTMTAESITAKGTAISPTGISGMIDGQTVRLGNRAFAVDNGDSEAGKHAGSADASDIWLSIDQSPAAVFAFGDQLRPDAGDTVRQLAIRGIPVILLSGDTPAATAAVAETLGIERSHGGLRPEDKAAVIEALQGGGKQAAMIGDGVNDAPALARADLAVALYSGSPLSEEVADISLMKGKPSQLLDFFEIAARVRTNINRNLGFSFIYNLIGIPAAMAGYLTPLVAVTAMLLSSLSVTLNTLFLAKSRMSSGHR